MCSGFASVFPRPHCNSKGSNLRHPSFTDTVPLEGCDVLLGMDIISQWHVTLHDGRCIIQL